MTNVYYNARTRQIYVDKPGGKTITIDLPAELDAVEIAYTVQSDTMRAVIEALTGGADDEH
ncbi:hypothetical protein [Sporosarcina newyorkensis]|uniref:hypothetical protein n=1 Tax=Sporosarcina newyorkensis TaxID=759851 RepID=UPI0009997A37|nr:hypothetical protein [Sporosarcina newyorkensis]